MCLFVYLFDFFCFLNKIHFKGNFLYSHLDIQNNIQILFIFIGFFHHRYFTCEGPLLLLIGIDQQQPLNSSTLFSYFSYIHFQSFFISIWLFVAIMMMTSFIFVFAIHFHLSFLSIFLRLLTIDDYGVFFFVESVALKKLDNNTCLDMDDIFSFLFFDSTFLHLFSLTISSSISREKW